MINTLIADDHQIVLDGLSLLLEREADIHKVGEALNGQAALQLLEKTPVDVAVLDIQMPTMDGLAATKAIVRDFPDTKVVILTMLGDNQSITQLVKAGASGYILKHRATEELVEAIRKVANGGQHFGEAVTNILIEGIRNPGKVPTAAAIQLTKREREILAQIGKGLNNQQISEALGISPHTVETHRRNVMEKVGAKNSVGLVKYALENNLTD